MPTRNITLITKQSNQPSSPLPSSAATGEQLINTADGKVYSKGFISGTGSTTFVPYLGNGAFFEVGSHLTQLKLDDVITTYSGISGAGLVGKFLSGTTGGLVLGNISDLSGTDSYLTGGTYSNVTKTLTLGVNNGKPSVVITGFSDTYITAATFTNNNLNLTNNTGGTVTVLLNNFSGLTVNGFLTAATIGATSISATTISAATFVGNGAGITGISSVNTFTTASTYNGNTGAITFTRNDGVTYSATGWNYLSAATLSAGNVLSITSNGGAPVNTTINAATGGTYANGTITLLGTGTVGTITGFNSLSSTTIYAGNGTLAGNRTVDLSSFTLNFSSNTQQNVLTLSGSNVGVGVAVPTNKLTVSAATDPLKVLGFLSSATDNTLMSINSSGVLHTMLMSGVTGNILPQTFGAVGDGVTDDTTALQAAINAAGNTGVLYLGDASKNYRVSGVSALTYSKIYGNGAKISRLANANVVLLSWPSSPQVQTTQQGLLAGIVFDGVLTGGTNIVTGTTGLKMFNNQNVDIRDVFVTNLDTGFSFIGTQFTTGYKLKGFNCNVGACFESTASAGGSNSWSLFDPIFLSCNVGIVLYSAGVFPLGAFYVRNLTCLSSTVCAFAAFNVLEVVIDGEANELTANATATYSYTTPNGVPLTVKKSSFYANASAVKLLYPTGSEAGVDTYIKAENVSSFNISNPNGYGFTTGKYFDGDANSTVSFNGQASHFGSSNNVLKMPDSYVSGSHGYTALPSVYNAEIPNEMGRSQFLDFFSDTTGALGTSTGVDPIYGPYRSVTYSAGTGNANNNRVRIGVTNTAGPMVFAFNVMSNLDTVLDVREFTSNTNPHYLTLKAGIWYRYYWTYQSNTLTSDNFVIYPTDAAGATVAFCKFQKISAASGMTTQGYITQVLQGAFKSTDTFQNKGATYTIGGDDKIINVTGGTFNVTLPTAIGLSGRTYTVKNSSTGVVTLNTTSSQTIDNALTRTLPQNATYTVVSDNINWKIIGIGDNTINAATGGTYSNGTITLSGTGVLGTITGLQTANTWTTGGTFTNNNLNLTNNTGGTVTVLLTSFSGLTVNGNISAATATISNFTATTVSATTFFGNGSNLTGIGGTTLTGGTFINNNLALTNNTGGTVNVAINGFSALTISGNTVITGTTNISGTTTIGGNLTAANLFTGPSGLAVIGSGGMIIGSGGTPSSAGVGDLVVNGSLTVFGQSVSAFTSQLYVEDNNIILNYNPTADTYTTALGAGFSVQDGLGVAAASADTVFYQIAQTGVPVNVGDAYAKLFWESNLFNLMLGSSGGTGSGFYVLKDQDILSGGVY